MPEVTTSPKPPAFTGTLFQDVKALSAWARDWYRIRVMSQRIAARIDAVKTVGVLSQTISNPPTQAEVQALQDKVNAIINAIQ